jgi:putative ABC transport system ATP-binding protein
MSDDVAVEARGVSKVYGKGALAHHALREVDFAARAGELVMLNGPSGSGKTTLLSILGCVLAPSSGEVTLFGEMVSGSSERTLPRLRLAYVGFIFQGYNLVASLDAMENVALPLELRGWSGRAARREAAAMLERVGLERELERRPRELSGGQRQRVAVARALAGSPPLVLADEPTSNLDATSGRAITTLLRDLAKEANRTVIVVTHDSRIFHLADRVVEIEDGRIVGRQPSGDPS